MSTLIVCCGNPIRMDDGVGWHIADALTRLVPADEVKVLVQPQLTPELADELATVDTFVIVDSSCTSSETRIDEISANERTATSDALMHALSSADLLGLTLMLFGRCPRTFVVSIKGFDYGLGSDLSEDGLGEAKKALSLIVSLLKNKNLFSAS